MERSDIEEIIDIIKEELNTVDKDCITVPVGGYRFAHNYETINLSLID